MKAHFDNGHFIIDFSIIAHVEDNSTDKSTNVYVITKFSSWDYDRNNWNNLLYLHKKDEAKAFLREYRAYLKAKEKK